MRGNNEEIDKYSAQDLEIMNTMEATKHFCLIAYIIMANIINKVPCMQIHLQI